MPGVVGPERVVNDRAVILDRLGGASLRVDIRFDPELHRYVCHELCLSRDDPDDPDGGGGPVTSEVLRQVTVREWIVMSLVANDPPVIRELDNPDGRDPWGFKPTDNVADAGPTDRALRWVGHIYRLNWMTAINPTKGVEEALGLPRSTTGRWVNRAREAGYLGPAAGVGKAGI